MGESCLKTRCYSPIACAGWGYCREQNLATDPMDKNGIRPADLIAARRAASKDNHSKPLRALQSKGEA